MERGKKTASFAGFLLLSGLALLGNYGTCSASETKASDSTNNNMDLTEAETLTDEALVYDLVPLGGEADNITRLQVDNLKEALGLQGNENEAEFSLCIWFELRLKTAAATLISYSANDSMTNVILLYVTDFTLGYMSDITGKDLGIPHMFEPLRWYHACLVVRTVSKDTEERTSGNDSVTYTLTVYVDGSQMMDDQFAVAFPLGGTLIIGQDQDGVATGFSKDQSFVGRVSLSGFKEAIGQSGTDRLFQCRVVKNQVPITWNVYGLVSKTSFDICKYNVDRGIVVPLKMEDKAKAKQMCELINTSLALPKSDDENDALAEQLSREHTCNSLPFFSFNIGWLGIFREENSGVLLQQESLKAYNKLSINISDIQTNDLFLTSDGTWKMGWPNIACPLCFGKPSAKFYLFGLYTTRTDKKMMVFYPRVSDVGSFFLYSSDGIVIEKDKKWKIIDITRNKTLASTEEPNFLGRKPWEVMNATSVYDRKSFFPLKSSSSSRVRTLTLSNCSLDEFTCNDGECKPMSCRCDFRQQCTNGEDEDSCNILNPLLGYEKGTPPPQRPLNLKVSVYLTKVASINILTETMQVNLMFRILWDDSRLTFKNLMGKERVNYLGQYMNTLWLPKFIVLNEEPLAGTAKPITKLYVVRKGTPIRVNQDYIYKGSESSLILTQIQSFYISCEFDMSAFPFDAQECWINITIQNVAQDSMWLAAQLKRTNDRLNLNEYDVLSRHLTVINGTMVIKVTLRRYPEYHILSSYFPVFLLHLLGYGTLFIDPRDFQDRGTMSLTSLLVLISFYSDTAMSLPKTSYLKLLDIWYIFSVTFLSLIIGVHLATNKVDKQKDPSGMDCKVRKVLPMSTGISESMLSGGLKPNLSSSELKAKPKRSYNASVLFVAKILFGLMYAIFHVMYWSKVFDNSLIF